MLAYPSADGLPRVISAHHASSETATRLVTTEVPNVAEGAVLSLP